MSEAPPPPPTSPMLASAVLAAGGATPPTPNPVLDRLSGSNERIVTPGKNIEEQVWYHGYRTRKDIVNLIHNPGEFLVRVTDNNEHHKSELILCVMDDHKKLLFLTVLYEADKCYLSALKHKKNKKKYNGIIDMVDSFLAKGKVTKDIPMKKPIPKPEWLIRHDAVKFDKKDLLGEGNFCKVFRGTYDFHGEIMDVAIKISHESSDDKTLKDEDYEKNKKARESMLAEAKMMSFLVHENVLRLYGVACDRQPIMIVLAYCPSGCLQKHLVSQKDTLTVVDKIRFCTEASRGMRYLHSNNLIHRDLAARNCLLDAKKIVKIADFGLSTVVGKKVHGTSAETSSPSHADDEKDLEQCPLRWMAPETLRRPRQFSEKSDVWSFGVLIFEIFNDGVKPWPNDENKRIATHIRRGRMPDVPEQTPNEIKEMVKKMWSLEPDPRPSMKTINSELGKLYNSLKADSDDRRWIETQEEENSAKELNPSPLSKETLSPATTNCSTPNVVTPATPATTPNAIVSSVALKKAKKVVSGKAGKKTRRLVSPMPVQSAIGIGCGTSRERDSAKKAQQGKDLKEAKIDHYKLNKVAVEDKAAKADVKDRPVMSKECEEKKPRLPSAIKVTSKEKETAPDRKVKTKPTREKEYTKEPTRETVAEE